MDTLSLMVALIGCFIMVGVFWIGVKLRQVHLLVNSRMEESLLRIKNLERAMSLGSGDPAPKAGSREERV